MAYKYFTQKLLSSDIDLSDVFPDTQEMARQQVNASYSLFEIAQFLQDRTDNFKKSEQQYEDLDSAISEIISKWYKSKGEENPFIAKEIEDEIAPPKTPREAVVLEEGKAKGKGAPKAAPEPIKKQKVSKKSQEDEIREEFQSIIDSFTILDEAEQDSIIEDIEVEMGGLEVLDDDAEAQLRLQILRDEVIPELKKLKA